MALLSSISRNKATNEISLTGLRVVILQLSQFEECYSNTIVVKSGLKSLTQASIITSSLVIRSCSNYNKVTNNVIDGGFNCYLKSCHLCKKPLCPDKDVYMYRGDQGFCSKECRTRQIMMDETKEMEANFKNKQLRAPVASSIDCHGCETCKLLEDLRQRRNYRNNKLNPVINPTKHRQSLVSFS